MNVSMAAKLPKSAALVVGGLTLTKAESRVEDGRKIGDVDEIREVVAEVAPCVTIDV